MKPKTTDCVVFIGLILVQQYCNNNNNSNANHNNRTKNLMLFGKVEKWKKTHIDDDYIGNYILLYTSKVYICTNMPVEK